MAKSKFPTAQHLSSAAHYDQIPRASSIEYCILGRSNVGKSSFINHLFSRKDLAKVSNTPGKTSLANFYKLDNNIIFVDMPGYGYARTAGKERDRWSKLISEYCTKRENLGGIIWLIDSRHPNTTGDIDAAEWLQTLRKPVLRILTKCDKLSRNELAANTREFDRQCIAFPVYVTYSIEDASSRERFWTSFEKWRNKG